MTDPYLGIPKPDLRATPQMLTLQDMESPELQTTPSLSRQGQG